MKKVEFNLGFYKAHHPKVVTRDGRKARIICTDKLPLSSPVVALISSKDTSYFGFEMSVDYYANGHYFINREDAYDLFMLIEE